MKHQRPNASVTNPYERMNPPLPYAVRLLERGDDEIAQLRSVVAACYGWPEANEKESIIDHFNPQGYTRIYVGQLADRIIAFALLGRTPGGVHIAQLGVHRKWRRQTYGQRLVAHLQNQLHQQKRMTAITPERDTRAIQFWRACHFEAAGVIRNAFGNDDGYQFVYEKKQHTLSHGATVADR